MTKKTKIRITSVVFTISWGLLIWGMTVAGSTFSHDGHKWGIAPCMVGLIGICWSSLSLEEGEKIGRY